MMNLNTPRIDDGTPLRAVELPFAESLPVIDYTAHTSECADDYADMPGAGVILWPIAVLLAAIVGAIVSLVRSST